MDRIEEMFAQRELPDMGTGTIPAHSAAPEMRFETSVSLTAKRKCCGTLLNRAIMPN